MSIENKKLIRDSFDMLNKHDMQSLEKNLDTKFFANVSEKVKRARTAFPDLKLSVEDVISEGDQVVATWTISGTHKGKIHKFKMGDVDPTNKRIKVSGVTIHRVTNGKIVETRGFGGELDALDQLGLTSAYAKAVSHQ